MTSSKFAVLGLFALFPIQADVRSVTAVEPERGKLRDTILVTVPGLRKWLAEDPARKPDFALYLDHMLLTGQQFGGVDPDRDVLKFRLDTNTQTKETWFALLRKPSLTPRRVTLSVGPMGGAEWPSAVDSFALTTIEPRWLWPWAIFFAGTAAAMVLLGKRTDMLRDSGALPPNPPPKSRKSFSLARVQMAWWTLLISGAFAFIFLVTWTDKVEPGVLVLLGISAATGLSAISIDNSKSDEATKQREALEQEKALLVARGAGATAADTARIAQIDLTLSAAEKQIAAPVSRGFWMDLIADFQGPALARFQLLLWTLILGAYFVIQVWWELTMPVFDSTQLILLGISSGTYLGFKFPEKPAP